MTTVHNFGTVAVLFGGTSAERNISLLSGNAVLKALQAQQINAVGIDVGADIISRLEALQPDAVFIALHGPGGEDGTLQGALEFLGIPYTGSGVLASALAMDKVRTKHLWQGMGIATAKFLVLNGQSHWQQCLDSLGGVAMVKPASEGSSIGMAKATTSNALAAAWREASNHDGDVIAEAWLSGDEYTVAILDGKALPAIKLETDSEFYDYEAKYLRDDTRYLCPCGLSSEQEAILQALALQAYHALSCRGWGRVDVMVDSNGQFQLLEVNTVPGMTGHSLVPMAANAVGLSFDELVVKILASATANVGVCTASTQKLSSEAPQVASENTIKEMP